MASTPARPPATRRWADMCEAADEKAPAARRWADMCEAADEKAPAARRWADMCETDEEEGSAASSSSAQEGETGEGPAGPGSPPTSNNIGELVHDSKTAVVTTLPGGDNRPTVTVVTPLREAQEKAQENAQENAPEGDPVPQIPPVVIWYDAVHYEEATGTPYVVCPTEQGPVAYYCEPPQGVGAPGDSPERCNDFPPTVHAVFDTPELSGLLCEYCIWFKNLLHDGDGELVEAFCGSCVTKLSRAPAYACACGKPRHLDALARPGGQWCSGCHKQKQRRGGGAKGRRAKGRR